MILLFFYWLQVLSWFELISFRVWLWIDYECDYKYDYEYDCEYDYEYDCEYYYDFEYDYEYDCEYYEYTMIVKCVAMNLNDI